MYTHILFPTDGSDRSQRAIRNCLQLARKLGAKVTGLYVSQRTYTDVDYDPKPLADSVLNKLAEEASVLGVSCECIGGLDDNPPTGIIRIAKERRCDLIVMATHGRSRVGKFLLGSTAATVLAESDIPVLLYR